ncbi:hypothetical protein BGZ76_000227 [Entomortierella beljakovae]|nr:hypothetical protein BGZ76_000227 [Entomortierella beljakovae]
MHAIRTAAIKPLSLYSRTSSRTWSNRLFSTSTILANDSNPNPPKKRVFIPKDPYILSEKIVKLSEQGKLDEAMEIVKSTPKRLQSEAVWNLLIQEKSKLGKTGESWQILSDMKKRGFAPSSRTYTILLNSLAINPSSPQSVERAMAFYQNLKDSEDLDVTVTHTNALLKVCSRKLDYSNIMKVYKEMPKSGPNAPDVITFNILINAFAHKHGSGDNNFNLAWGIWQDYLEAKTDRPDEVDLDQTIVDSILMACRTASNPWNIRRGFNIVESLYDLSSSSNAPSTGNNPKPSSVQTTEDKAMDPGKSLGIGAVFKVGEISPRTVDLLLSLCMKLTEYNRGQKYLDNIYKSFPNFKPDAQLLSIQMLFQINTKDYEKAIESWDQIKVLGLKHTPGTFKQGLDASYRARNWEKTMEMFREMRKLIKENKRTIALPFRPSNSVVDHQDAWSLTSVLKCAVKTKHISEAIQILHECRWTSVIQSPRYPRANHDLAELAVKIYSTALRGVQSANKLGETSQYKMNEQAIERELDGAQKWESTMKSRLEVHDAKRAEVKQMESEVALHSKEARLSAGSATNEGKQPFERYQKKNSMSKERGEGKNTRRGNGRWDHGSERSNSRERDGLDDTFKRSMVFKREVF